MCQCQGFTLSCTSVEVQTKSYLLAYLASAIIETKREKEEEKKNIGRP